MPKNCDCKNSKWKNSNSFLTCCKCLCHPNTMYTMFDNGVFFSGTGRLKILVWSIKFQFLGFFLQGRNNQVIYFAIVIICGLIFFTFSSVPKIFNVHIYLKKKSRWIFFPNLFIPNNCVFLLPLFEFFWSLVCLKKRHNFRKVSLFLYFSASFPLIFFCLRRPRNLPPR